MKFYKRFPGDIQIKTGGLTLAEFGAYDRLLDHYYATEEPIAPDEVYSITRALTRADRGAVDKVLGKFFDISDGGYTQQRADEMIAEAQPKIEAARTNGKSGGRPPKNQTGTKEKPTGLSNGTKAGTKKAKNAKASQSQSNTPHTPQGGAVSLRTWLEAIKASGEKPIPEGDPVFSYIDDIKLPHEFLALAWKEFRHRYSQPDAKRYRDWRAVFRKAVRGNWLKLWWSNGDEYQLTTTGLQAQRAHQEKAAA